MLYMWEMSFWGAFSLSQLSSNAVMEIDAYNQSSCVMDSMTVKTDPMKWIVQLWLRAAITAVITTLAVYLTLSCVMERETVLMDQMRQSVVGDVQYCIGTHKTCKSNF